MNERLANDLILSAHQSLVDAFVDVLVFRARSALGGDVMVGHLPSHGEVVVRSNQGGDVVMN